MWSVLRLLVGVTVNGKTCDLSAWARYIGKVVPVEMKFRNCSLLDLRRLLRPKSVVEAQNIPTKVAMEIIR